MQDSECTAEIDDASRTDVLMQRIAKLMLDIDALAASLAGPLQRARTAAMRDAAKLVDLESQSLRLAVSLERQPPELHAAAEALAASASRLKARCATSTLPHELRAGVALLAQLTAELPPLFEELGATDAAA